MYQQVPHLMYVTLFNREFTHRCETRSVNSCKAFGELIRMVFLCRDPISMFKYFSTENCQLIHLHLGWDSCRICITSCCVPISKFKYFSTESCQLIHVRWVRGLMHLLILFFFFFLSCVFGGAKEEAREGVGRFGSFG